MKVSKKTGWMIAASFLVSAALIVTVVLYAINVYKNEPMQSAEMWFVIGMVAIAALTFGLFVWFRLHKNKYVKKLDPQYFAAYEKLTDALQDAKMSKAEIKDTKIDILVIMLEAQERRRDVSEVIGDDIEEFAGRIKASFGYRSSFLFELCSILQYGIFFVVFIHVLLYFSKLGNAAFFECDIGLSLAIMFIPIIFVIYPFIKRSMRKDKTAVAMMTPLIYGVAFIILTIVLDNFFGNLAWVRYLLDTQIVMISSLWQLVVMAAVFLLAHVVKIYLRRQSIKRLNEVI